MLSQIRFTNQSITQQTSLTKKGK